MNWPKQPWKAQRILFSYVTTQPRISAMFSVYFWSSNCRGKSCIHPPNVSLQQRGWISFADDDDRQITSNGKKALWRISLWVFTSVETLIRMRDSREVHPPIVSRADEDFIFEKRGGEIRSGSVVIALLQETAKSHQVPLGRTDWALQDHSASCSGTEHRQGMFSNNQSANIEVTCHRDMCFVAALPLRGLAPVHTTVWWVGVWDVVGHACCYPLDAERVRRSSGDVSPHWPAVGVSWHCAL